MWQCRLLVAWRAGSHSWGCHRNHPGVPCIFVGTPPPTIIDGTSSQAHLLAMSSFEYKLFKGFIKADNPIQTNKSKSRLLHFVALIFPKQFALRESHSKPKKKNFMVCFLPKNYWWSLERWTSVYLMQCSLSITITKSWISTMCDECFQNSTVSRIGSSMQGRSLAWSGLRIHVRTSFKEQLADTCMATATCIMLWMTCLLYTSPSPRDA